MRIPILNGIYGDSEFHVQYPVNMMPVVMDTGISPGYLKTHPGALIENTYSGGGKDRGAYNWNGEHFRLIGNDIIQKVDETVIAVLASITGPGNDWATFHNSFDYLSMSTDGKLWLYKSGTVTQVTDPDLGTCIDHVWLSGYFISTDGEFLVTSDINDPFSYNPLKYGSSEFKPDPIIALKTLNNELYALNRSTIEVFRAVPSTGFPFRRIESAQMRRGVVGTHACAVFMDNIAFLGGGENEPDSVWLGINGNTVKISTRRIDEKLLSYTEAERQAAKMEVRVTKDHELLYLHMPDSTFVYDAKASRKLNEHVWFILSSSKTGDQPYIPRNFVYVKNKWYCGSNGAQIAYLKDDVFSDFGVLKEWSFQTKLVFNEEKGILIHEMELDYAQITGNVWTKADELNLLAQTEEQLNITHNRAIFFQQGYVNHWRVQKFRGDGRSSISSLNIRLEGLQW